jgi:hypothetical protein
MDRNSGPIFIVGASRSGTTMLRLILNGHSRIAIPGEMKYFHRLPGGALKRWRSPDWNDPALAGFLQAFTSRLGNVLSGIDVTGVDFVGAARAAGNLKYPFQQLMEMWVAEHGKKRWGEKTPRNLFVAEQIIDMFPDASFIYMYRDPRGVVSSMNGIEYFPDDTAANALHWRDNVTHGRTVFAKSVAPSQRHSVRYESLVSNPETEVAAICEFLGESFESAMLNFHETSQAWMTTIRTPNIMRPISAENAEKWRQLLDSRQQRMIETICAAEMRALGYEPELSGRRVVAALDAYAQVARVRLTRRTGLLRSRQAFQIT